MNDMHFGGGDFVQCSCGCTDFVTPQQFKGDGDPCSLYGDTIRLRCLKCGTVWVYAMKYDDENVHRWEKET